VIEEKVRENMKNCRKKGSNVRNINIGAP